jgi:murein DD-endopeptidase MepM/ murein hydrolase activator NlpD
MTKLDYSPALARRRSHSRRVLLLGVLCATCISALTLRDSDATRTSLPASDVSEATAATASARNANAFDQAVQTSVSDSLPVPAASEWTTVTVKPGESISSIIEAIGMSKTEWIALMGLGRDVAPLKSLRVGNTLHVLKNGDDELEELTYEYNETHTLQVRRVNDKLESAILEAALEHRPTDARGTITSSLFADGHKAGLSDRLVMQLANLFAYDIDFALDLKEGDHFSVVYDSIYKNGEKLRDGEILAAEFVNNGKRYRSMRYVYGDGNVAYYTPEGQSFRKAFIRTPVDFARISSGFNLHRMHPILNIIRAHKGVDYAAATGTPVKATGDGVVEFMGVKHGYGNVLMLKHGSRYETVYAHLSRYRKGLRNGMSVKQGQVIAYVGMTGLATAPHLHYEFHVNGVYKNPMTVALPRANPLSRKQVAEWRAKNAIILAQLDGVNPQQIAQISAGNIRR